MARDPRFDELLRHGVDEPIVATLEAEVRDASDDALARINPLAFAEAHRLDPDRVIGALLRASRLGLFDQVWNIHCPSCRRVISSGTSARDVKAHEYYCTVCDLKTQPTLDEKVEVTFAVNPRLRKLSTDLTPMQVVLRSLSSSVQVDARLEKAFVESMIDMSLVKPGESRTVHFEAGERSVAVKDMTLHGTYVLPTQGAPVGHVQEVEVAFEGRPSREVRPVQPGQVALRFHNHSLQSMLITTGRASDELKTSIHRARPFLGAKRLMVHPAFRELYRTDALDVDQQLKLESLTVLFTDLKGSTELYGRVGDLTAFALVRKHFDLLEQAVASEGGSVVKTIGDAVMATFTEPSSAMAAALKMREALSQFNQRGPSDLLIKIGLHDGPCLAVMLNDRLDYFGQTVNVAARVQGIAQPQAILATASVLHARGVADLLGSRGVQPQERQAELKGIQGAVTVFEIA